MSIKYTCKCPFLNKGIMHSLATLWGPPVKSNTIPYNSSATNSTFSKIMRGNHLTCLLLRLVQQFSVVLNWTASYQEVFVILCLSHLQTGGWNNIWITFQCKAFQYTTTANYYLNNKHIKLSPLWHCSSKLLSFVKVEFIAEMLYWIALHSLATE